MPCVPFSGRGWHFYTSEGVKSPVRAIWEDVSKNHTNGGIGRPKRYPQKTTLIERAGGKKEDGNRGCKAGSNCVQVKGRVAFGSPLARFTPHGKAVRRFSLPPGKCELSQIGWPGSPLSDSGHPVCRCICQFF